ncbi:hypothetical protein AGIG_G5245 [Arapaima gigas]
MRAHASFASGKREHRSAGAGQERDSGGWCSDERGRGYEETTRRRALCGVRRLLRRAWRPPPHSTAPLRL